MGSLGPTLRRVRPLLPEHLRYQDDSDGQGGAQSRSAEPGWGGPNPSRAALHKRPALSAGLAVGQQRPGGEIPQNHSRGSHEPSLARGKDGRLGRHFLGCCPSVVTAGGVSLGLFSRDSWAGAGCGGSLGAGAPELGGEADSAPWNPLGARQSRVLARREETLWVTCEFVARALTSPTPRRWRK